MTSHLMGNVAGQEAAKVLSHPRRRRLASSNMPTQHGPGYFVLEGELITTDDAGPQALKTKDSGCGGGGVLREVHRNVSNGKLHGSLKVR